MSYSHLTISERACVYQFRHAGMSIREIARALNRNASTISREFKSIGLQSKSQVGLKVDPWAFLPSQPFIDG